MKNKKCILVSACLLGENCKYNGGNNYNQAVIDFVADKDVLAVCPEVAGGLPVPREPVEILKGRPCDVNGNFYDKEFQVGIDRTLSSLAEKRLTFLFFSPEAPLVVSTRFTMVIFLVEK